MQQRAVLSIYIRALFLAFCTSVCSTFWHSYHTSSGNGSSATGSFTGVTRSFPSVSWSIISRRRNAIFGHAHCQAARRTPAAHRVLRCYVKTSSWRSVGHRVASGNVLPACLAAGRWINNKHIPPADLWKNVVGRRSARTDAAVLAVQTLATTTILHAYAHSYVHTFTDAQTGRRRARLL